jgi:sarcosine oxidase subunit alpha
MKITDLRLSTIERKKPVTVLVNGRQVSAFEGEPLYAVLLAAGYRQLRKSVSETENRGFFCGMGVCYECLVTVDNKERQRACVLEVYDGMRVEIDGI